MSCTEGTCNAGVCECNDGYEKSDSSDPRLCTLIQCPVLTLNNQAVDVTGPYNPTTAVVVTCSAGYFVDGEADNTLTVQTVTCNQGGAFDVDLKPCVGELILNCKILKVNANQFLPLLIYTIL